MSSTRSFEGFVLPISLPLYFWKRTQLGRRAMSALCQNRKSKPQLLYLEVSCPYHLAQFLGFIAHELAEVRG
jgi:hypothetical protein